MDNDMKALLSGHTLKEVETALPLVFRIKRTPIVWGPPGIGKTAMINKLAKDVSYTIKEAPNDFLAEVLPDTYGKVFQGRKVFPVRLIICNPTDMKGIPVFDTEYKEAVWVMTGLFPTAEKALWELEYKITSLLSDGREVHPSLITRLERALHDQHALLFMDEITQAPQTVQHSALQILLDRSSGTYDLPDAVDVICAGNRASDKAGSHSMSSVLGSRLVHFYIECPSVDEFLEIASNIDFEPSVMGYLKAQPDMLYTFDPTKFTGAGETHDATFACPRTWEMVSDLLKITNNADILETIIPGMIGGVANDFLSWLKMYKNLADPDAYLDGSVSLKEVGETFHPDGVYSVSLEYSFLIRCIRECSKNLSEDRVRNLCKLFMRDESTVDIAVSAMMDMKKHRELKLDVVRSDMWEELSERINVENVFTDD